MSVELELDGLGTLGNIKPGWSVVESITPLNPGERSGSVGSVSLATAHGEDSEFVIDDGSVFTHDSLGTISGQVARAESTGSTEDLDVNMSLQLTTVLTRLAVERTAQPLTVASPIQTYGNFPTYTAEKIAMDSDYSVFIASDDHFVYKYAPDGTFITKFGGAGGFDGSLNIAGGMAFSPLDGSLWVTDRTNNRVTQYITNDGGLTYIYNYKFTETAPGGIAFDGAGSIYLTRINTAINRVAKWTTANGGLTYSASTTWGATGAGNGQFSNLGHSYSIATDSLGAVYVTETGNGGRIQKFTNTGTYVLKWTIQNILAMTINDNDEIYYHDSIGKVITKATTTGSVISNSHTFLNVHSLYSVGKKIVAMDFGTASIEELVPARGVLLLGSIVLSNVISYYIGLVDPTIPMTYSCAEDPECIAPGWTDDVWTKLKDLASAYYIEIAPVNDTIVVRNVGQVPLSLDNAKDVSLNLDARGQGRSVEIINYNSVENYGVVYDTRNTSKIFEIDVGEVYTETVISDVSLTGVQYRINQDTDHFSGGTLDDGFFTVIDSLGNIVPWPYFVSNGAEILAKINTTIPNAVDITFIGPKTALFSSPAPYKIAQVIDGVTYGGLSVIGSGVFMQSETITLSTGANEESTPTLVAQSIKNVFIDTLERAYDSGAWAAVEASGPIIELTASVPTADIVGFGLTTGSVVSFKESKYRINSLRIGNAWTTLTAHGFVLTSDIDALNGVTQITNEIWNPSGRRVTTGYAVQGGGSMSQSVGNYTQHTAASAVAAGNTGILLQILTVGTDILPSTQYTYSIDLLANSGHSVRAYAIGAGAVGTPLTSSIVAVGAGWVRVTITFTTAASGTVGLYMLNAALSVVGGTNRFRDAMVQLGPSATTYFDGSTDFASWAGTVDFSPSTQTYADFTTAQWDAFWGNYKTKDFKIKPLRPIV